MAPSLLHELACRLHGWLATLLVLATAALLLWKQSVMPYPPINLVCELALSLLLGLVEALRLNLARRGNLTASSVCALVAIALAVPSSLAALYFLLWQTYVLRIEAVIYSLHMALVSAEMLGGAVGVFTSLFGSQ